MQSPEKWEADVEKKFKGTQMWIFLTKSSEALP